MMNNRIWQSALILALAAGASAQSWKASYDAGLQAARQFHWADARSDFKQAAAYRPDDVSSPTILPGPPTAARKWRDGSPYSPNFLAAYSGYKLATTLQPAERDALLSTVAGEFETLLAKHQVSKESFYLVGQIYALNANQVKFKAVQDKYGSAANTTTWKVDDEVVAPEELAAITASFQPSGSEQSAKQNNNGTVSAQSINPSSGQPFQQAVGFGSVAPVISKYALVIGNRNTQLPQGVSFAANDAARVRDSLVNYAGYPLANVEVITDATATEVMSRAKALADRMPDTGTLCIFFTGIGVNIDGRDFLAASDTRSLTDKSSMISKSELFTAFIPKSTHIFSFFQVDRSRTTEATFGSEGDFVGSVSQMEATLPGEPIYISYLNQKQTGLFTTAFVQTLTDLQSNKLPIMEFGWQIFNHMRRGETGLFGGSSRQTCTLPHLNNLATDARF